MSENVFKTEDVLSCSTGRLLGDIGGVYKVAEYLTGGPVWTHQLAILGRQMEKALRIAHPELLGRDDAEHVNQENYEACRDEWIARLGPTLALAPELAGCLTNGNPIEDLQRLCPDKPIIVVSP